MVYVLKLKDNKYYVGYCAEGRFNIRLREHVFFGNTVWTKLYKFVEVLEIHEGEGKVFEKEKTLEYMRKYGWDNVRGACWTARDLNNRRELFKTLGIQLLPENLAFVPEYLKDKNIQCSATN